MTLFTQKKGEAWRLYRRILHALILIFITVSVHAANRHVSLTGSDSNPGTASQPWRTLTYAGEAAVAGDVVQIHEGIYYHRLIVRNSGTSGNPIVFKNFQDDIVIIETRETQLYPELDRDNLGRIWFGAVDFYNQRWIEFYGLHIRNASLGAGFFGQNSHNIIIDGCKVNKTQNSAVSLLLDGVQYDGNGEVFPQDQSKWTFNTNITVRNCEITRSSNSEYVGWMEIISLEGVIGFEVHDNHLFKNSAGDPNNFFGGGGENIDAKRGSSNGSIHHNYIHDSPRLGIYVEGWDGAIDNIDIYSNEVHNCNQAGISIGIERNGSVNGIDIYNNKIYDNVLGISFQDYAAATQQPVSNINVYNNTIVDNTNVIGGGVGFGAYGFLIDNPEISNLVIRNNIVEGHYNDHVAKAGDVSSSQYTIDNNLFWPVQSGDIIGTNPISLDPLFLDQASHNYRLQASSPAIGSATSPLLASKDYDGNARPAGGSYELGAWEYVGATNPSIPETPSGLSATAVSYYRVDLTWSSVSGADFYIVERRAGSGAWEYVTGVKSGVTSYSNFSVAPSTSYTYRIKARNAGGESSFSSGVNATTAEAPEYEAENNTGTNGSTQTANTGYEGSGYVQVNTYIEWNNVNFSAGTYDLQFRYAHGSSPKPCNVIVNGSNVGTLQFASTGGWTNWRRAVLNNIQLISGNNTIRLESVTGAGLSLNIDKMYVYGAGGGTPPVVTIPSAPSGLTATSTSSTQINLTWSDNSNNETGFKIERKTGASGSWSQIATSNANTTSYSSTSLTASTTYYYRVRSYNTAGNSSSYTGEVSATTSSVAPSTTYEAESYTSAAADFASSNGGFEGTGYMDYGSYVEWNNVSPGSAGTYNLVFRYANGSGSNRTCEVFANGVQVGTATFGNSGGWTTWATNTIFGVSLTSGSNTIRVEVKSGFAGPNLDNLKLVSATTIGVTGVSVSPTSLSITASNSSALGATVSPSNATNQSLTWSSSNTAVATVNSGGVVTAVSAGSATITATSVSNPSVSSSSAVTVTSTGGGGSGFTQSSGSDGLVVMEAENYTSKQTGSSLSTCNYQEYNDSGASNGKYMMVPDGSCGQGSGNNGPHIDFDVNFVKSGTHYLLVRMIAEDANDDSCIPYYNATSKGNWYTGTTGGTWTWKKKTFTGVSTGNQTVSIYMREDGLKIDKLLLTTNDSYVPTGSESESPSARNAGQSLVGNENDISIEIYPNPASEKMTLDLGEVIDAQMTVFDLAGHEVMSKKITSGKINISLPRGMYLLKLTTAESVFTQKIIFQ